jgi:Flp pilus assembly protein protease CpaA
MHGVLDGWIDLGSSVAAAAITFVIMMIFFCLHTTCGGDVKLLTAVAAFAAMPHVFLELFCISLAGGLYGLVIIAWKRQFRKRIFNVYLIMMHHVHGGLIPPPELTLEGKDALKMSYGVAVAIGSTAVLAITRGLK